MAQMPALKGISPYDMDRNNALAFAPTDPVSGARGLCAVLHRSRVGSS
jgi:hypothetical protein